jgi:dTDP-4-dehydrorhamnose reductase
MPFFERIGVIGSTGQFGTDVVAVLGEAGFAVTPLPHQVLDVTDRPSVERTLERERLDAVVNCAAFHKVDECEDRPEEAFSVNARGAFEVARACARTGALCVFVSTDYVFSGEKGSPYTEEDIPNPINVYGASKVAAETLVRQAAPQWLILRIASVFGKAGARGKGGNFVEAILAKAKSGEPVRVVNDQWMSPTYTRDAARQLEQLLRSGATGLYHVTNDGRCTWLDFAREALRLARINVPVEPTSSETYPGKARRPRDSSLTTVRSGPAAKARRPWEQALRDYLREKGHLTT